MIGGIIESSRKYHAVTGHRAKKVHMSQTTMDQLAQELRDKKVSLYEKDLKGSPCPDLVPKPSMEPIRIRQGDHIYGLEIVEHQDGEPGMFFFST